MLSSAAANQWDRTDGQPLILDMGSMPFAILNSIRVWTMAPKLAHVAPAALLSEDLDIGGEELESLRAALCKLAESGRDGRMEGYLAEQEEAALEFASDAGLAERKGRYWHLIEMG